MQNNLITVTNKKSPMPLTMVFNIDLTIKSHFKLVTNNI